MLSQAPSRLTTFALLFVWIGAYFGARAAIPQLPTDSWLRVGVALAPLLPTIGMLWLSWAAIRGLDELQRRVHLEALAVAFTLAIVMLWTLGLLELAITLDQDNWSYRHVWAFLPMFYFIGLAISWRRYR